MCVRRVLRGSLHIAPAPTPFTMSYVPPHLRDRTRASIQQPIPNVARNPRPDPSVAGRPYHPPPSSHNTAGHGLGTSRHAYGSYKAPSPRPSRRLDTGSVLESNPNDIKPRRPTTDVNSSRRRNESQSLADRMTTEMELLGTVSRSGGVGDENDAYVETTFSGQTTWVDMRCVPAR